MIQLYSKGPSYIHGKEIRLNKRNLCHRLLSVVGVTVVELHFICIILFY